MAAGGRTLTLTHSVIATSVSCSDRAASSLSRMLVTIEGSVFGGPHEGLGSIMDPVWLRHDRACGWNISI
jgi:hypothetical protein